MGRAKLFTVSLCLILAACSDDKKQEFDFDDEEPEVIEELDSNARQLIIGTWELEKLNEVSVDELNIKGLRQAFLSDRTWLLSKDLEDTTIVGGGKWNYDPMTHQLNVFALPDSISKTTVLVEINQKKMVIETLDSSRQVWKRIKADPEASL